MLRDLATPLNQVHVSTEVGMINITSVSWGKWLFHGVDGRAARVAKLKLSPGQVPSRSPRKPTIIAVNLGHII